MKIKKESVATRCEICHRAVLLEADNNCCVMCLQVNNSHGDNNSKLLSAKTRQPNTIKIILSTILGYLAGAVIGLFLCTPFLSSHWWKYAVLSSHWWKYVVFPITLFTVSLVVGEIFLPFIMFRKKVDRSLYLKLFSWTVTGILSTISGGFLRSLVRAWFVEKDSLDLFRYEFWSIIEVMMLGTLLGPIVGILVENYNRSKYKVS